MATRIKDTLPLGILLGAYMAFWIHSEAHVASLLGIVSKGDGLIAGLLVSLTVWIRLQSSLRSSRILKSIGRKRIVLILSPIVSALLYNLIINSNDKITALLLFSIFTAFIGVIISIFTNKIYNELEPELWNTAVSLFKSTTVVFQIITLILLRTIQDFNIFIYILYLTLFVTSIVAAIQIHGVIISSRTIKVFDLISGILSNPWSYKLITDSDINKISSILAGLFITKIIVLPKATKSDPLTSLALYAIAYLIGTLIATRLYKNLRILYIIPLISFILISLNINYLVMLILLGLSIGFVEVSLILILLSYKPRHVAKSNIVPSQWIIFASILVGVLSMGIPKYSAYFGILIVLIGLFITK